MYFIFCAAAFLLASANAIHHGKDASILDFPYLVSIELEGNPTCAGSILSPNWVLTTYFQCVDWKAPKSHTIRAGSGLRAKGGSLHRVDRVIRHELYNENYKRVPFHNIALVHVTEPIVFDDLRQPIGLFNKGEHLVPGTKGNVSGFGAVGQNRYPERLQRIELPLMNLNRCKAVYRDKGGVTEAHICAASEDYEKGGRNACVRDEGAPLVVEGRLAGMASYIASCWFMPYYPVLYTDVGHYRDWIDQHVSV